MLQAWGRRTSPRTPSSSLIGAGRIRCSVAQNSLLAPVAPADAAPRAPSTPSSATNRAPSAVGTPPVPEKPVAGWITPAKLSRLSDVLHMPVTRVETVLQGTPAAVRQMEPEQVAQRLQELCSGLGVLPRQAAFMVAKQPAYMLLTPLADMHAKMAELAAALGIPQAAVLRAAVTIPSILRRSTPVVERRVRAYGALLRCAPLDVLHVMARGPEYLSDTPSSVRQRMTALGYVLRRPRCTIAAMLQARPDLVFMSGRVMNSKVNGLMCILNKQKHHVVTLIVKLPALLRCNLDAVRHAFGGLQALLRKREGFVYAMICHAPGLLLLTPRGLHQRCTALRRCLAASPEWCEQFTQLRPPGVAQLLLNRRGSLSAMMYLTQRRRAGAAPLAQLLAPGAGPAAALGEAWPDLLEWMERRRQYVALRTRQHRAALRGAAERAARAGQGAASGTASAQQPQLPQLQQDAPQQREQQPGASASTAAATPCLSVGAVAAAAVAGGHLAAGGLQRHAEPRLAAAGARAQRQECSSSNGDGGSSSRTSSSSRNVESESEGASQQDVEGGVATDRGQQPGASVSGRPASWLQLQADYRRSLQSRARRKPAQTAQQGKWGKGRTQAAPAASPGAKTRAGLRRRSQSQRVDMAAPTAASVWATTAAATSATAVPVPSDSSSASAGALGQPGMGVAGNGPPSVAAGPFSQPANMHRALAAAGGSEPQHVLGVGHAASGSGGNGNLPSSGAGGQHRRHVLSGLLLPGRGQRPDVDPAGVALGGPNAACATAVGGELAPQLPASGGFASSQQAEAIWEWNPAAEAAAAAGGIASAQGKGAGGSGPPARQGASTGGSSDDGNTSCSAHAHAVDPDARPLPLWLRLDPDGVGNGGGGEAHSGSGDGGYASERERPGEGGAQYAEALEHAATDPVVVVGGDGSIRDIKGLGRDSHALGRRGQENGGGLSIGQAQKLESALGAIVPR